MRHAARHSGHLAALGLATLGLAAALTACAGARPPPSASGGVVRDRDLGLSKTSVFEAPAPPVWKEETAGPGEKPRPPRISAEIPPVIPHAVADIQPIKVEQNACVDCHQVEGSRKSGDPTPLPASHFTDLRRPTPEKGDKVAGVRWICTTCHVTRTDAPPLVTNGFRP